MLPTTYDPTRGNEISQAIQKIEGGETVYVSTIEAHDTELHEKIYITESLASAVLGSTLSLLREPTRNRDYEANLQNLKRLLKGVKERRVDEYRKWLESRKIPHSKQTTQVEAFEEKLRKKISKALDRHADAIRNDSESYRRKYQLKLKKAQQSSKQIKQMRDGVAQKIQEHRVLHDYYHLQSLKLSLQRDVKTIWEACERGSLSYVKTLFKEGGNNWVNNGKKSDDENIKGSTALHFASGHGHTEIVQLLLTNGANPSAQNFRQQQPIHWAAKTGNIPIAEALLEAGCSLDAKDDFGRTPLHFASFNGQGDMVKFLLEHGADVNVKAGKEETYVTPLHDAVQTGKDGAFIYLTRHRGIDVNITDGKNRSPLFCAVQLGHIFFVTRLLGHRSRLPNTSLSEDDPNRIENLLTLDIDENKEEIHRLLYAALPARNEQENPVGDRGEFEEVDLRDNDA